MLFTISIFALCGPKVGSGQRVTQRLHRAACANRLMVPREQMAMMQALDLPSSVANGDRSCHGPHKPTRCSSTLAWRTSLVKQVF